MAKYKIVRLGTLCTDQSTGILGAPTHLNISGSGNRIYFFQPKKLNPDTKMPVHRMRVDESRFSGVKASDYAEIDLPTEMIGKIVEDRITGYKGAVIGITLHINGCVHYVVQAQGYDSKNSPIEAIEIDPRSCVDSPPEASALPVSPGDPFTCA